MKTIGSTVRVLVAMAMTTGMAVDMYAASSSTPPSALRKPWFADARTAAHGHMTAARNAAYSRLTARNVVAGTAFLTWARLVTKKSVMPQKPSTTATTKKLATRVKECISDEVATIKDAATVTAKVKNSTIAAYNLTKASVVGAYNNAILPTAQYIDGKIGQIDSAPRQETDANGKPLYEAVTVTDASGKDHTVVVAKMTPYIPATNLGKLYCDYLVPLTKPNPVCFLATFKAIHDLVKPAAAPAEAAHVVVDNLPIASIDGQRAMRTYIQSMPYTTLNDRSVTALANAITGNITAMTPSPLIPSTSSGH